MVTESGRALGRVAEVLPYPAQDLWRVVDEDGTETLVPAVEELVVSVDIAGGRAVVRDAARADGSRRGGLEPGDLRQLRRLLQDVALAVSLHEPAALEVGHDARDVLAAAAAEAGEVGVGERRNRCARRGKFRRARACPSAGAAWRPAP